MPARELPAKGFASVAVEALVKRLDDVEEVEVEKGLLDAFERPVELPPKIAFPRFGFGAPSTAFDVIDCCGLSSSAFSCPEVILVPLKALIEPSFLLHCLCLQT